MKPLVKICGLTRPEDARLAVELGATHLGVVLAPASPRRVTLEQARRVFEAGGDSVRHVLVFKGEPAANVLRLAGEVGTRDVELFDATEEDARLVEDRGFTVYRVYPVPPDADRLPPFVRTPTAEEPAVLDTSGGGTGRVFPWALLGRKAPPATFIAGGITPANVRELLEHRPYGLDLSSGVESAPGIKHPARLALFFRRLEEV